MSNAAIFYRGASELDPTVGVVGIIVGLKTPSANKKTGAMLQTYIMLDAVHPLDAVRNGKDAAVCGDCAFRSGNGCYVNVERAPSNLWKKRNSLPSIHASGIPVGSWVRVGTYGDPCALPYSAWLALLPWTGRRLTGYTHQWRRPTVQPFKRFCMASTEDTASTQQAQAMGWRTFRVRAPGAPLLDSEIECANTTSGVQCINCGLCNGTLISPDYPGSGAKNISIEVHGGAVSARRANNAVHWAELLRAGVLTP